MSFEEYLVSRDLISEIELDKVDRFRKETGSNLYTALRKASVVQSHALVRAISDFHGVPMVEDDQWLKHPASFNNLSQAFLRENKVFPIGEGVDGILLAMEDPSDAHVINAVRLALERPIIPRVAAADDIQTAIERSARSRDEPNVWQDATKAESSGDDLEHLRDMALGAPVVRFVNQMIQDAIHSRATDIHVEPFDGRVAVRLRVDGMLREMAAPPAQMAKAIISRIKILSGLNIAERRLPQDGRAKSASTSVVWICALRRCRRSMARQ